MYSYRYNTVIGWLCIVANNTAVLQINFNGDILGEEKETEIIVETYRQLKAYFIGERKELDIPLELIGTDFQKKVWNELMKIPYGSTRSYKQVATAIGNEKACRAVGIANNRNPIPIIIPCHRVIGTSGKLVGYAGGLDIKNQLLGIEKSNLSEG